MDATADELEMFLEHAERIYEKEKKG